MKILMKFAVVCVFLLPSIAEASMSDEAYATARRAIKAANINDALASIMSERIEQRYHIFAFTEPKFLCEFAGYKYPKNHTMEDAELVKGREEFFKLPLSKITKMVPPIQEKTEPSRKEELYGFLTTMSDQTWGFHSTELRSIQMDISGPQGFGFTLRFIPYGQTLIGPNLEKTVILNEQTAELLAQIATRYIIAARYGYLKNNAFACHRTKEEKEHDYKTLLAAQNENTEASMSDEDYATAHKTIQRSPMNNLLKVIVPHRTQLRYHVIESYQLSFLCEFEDYIAPENATSQGFQKFFQLLTHKMTRVVGPEKTEPSRIGELHAFLTMPDRTGHYNSKLRSISVDIFGPKHYGFTLRFIPEGQTLIGPNLEKTVTLNKKTILLLRNQLNTGIDQETYGYRATDLAFICNRTKQQKESDYQALLDAQNAPDSDSE